MMQKKGKGKMNETICAIATQLGNSAINIIRISGNKSKEIAEKFFTSKNLNFNFIEPRKMYYGTFKYQEINESCLMVYFKSPYSYTGEDVVEFQIHGGEFLAKRILQIISCFCQLATPGEFSKRAFFNGKITLSQAEGIIDLINAESEEELKSAYNLSTGAFNKNIFEIQNTLKNILAQIEVALDYPEHDEELITVIKSKKELIKIENNLNELLANSSSGEKLKNGVNIAIIGSPNVGKSSLLNAILGRDRAIVSSIAGTTRDTVNETIIYKGVKFNFTDTAGIREISDEIERQGIEKAKEEIKLADLILFVIDSSRALTKDEEKMLNELNTGKTIMVYNKKDISIVNGINENAIEISSLYRENINELLEKIYEKSIKEKIDTTKIMLTNLRHINILKEAVTILKDTVENINNLTLDVLAFKIKQIWSELGKITGETENEQIIDEIFSKFCLGK